MPKPYIYRENQAVSLEVANALRREIQKLRRKNGFLSRCNSRLQLSVIRAEQKLLSFERGIWKTLVALSCVFAIKAVAQNLDETPSAEPNQNGAGGAMNDREAPEEEPICPVPKEVLGLSPAFRETLDEAFGARTECVTLMMTIVAP